MESKTNKLLLEINKLNEEIILLSEKNTELVSELEISLNNKQKNEKKLSFHSAEPIEKENLANKDSDFKKPEHRRTGSLFNEIICLRKMENSEEEGEKSRKGSFILKDDLMNNLFIQEKFHNLGFFIN